MLRFGGFLVSGMLGLEEERELVKFRILVTGRFSRVVYGGR